MLTPSKSYGNNPSSLFQENTRVSLWNPRLTIALFCWSASVIHGFAYIFDLRLNDDLRVQLYTKVSICADYLILCPPTVNITFLEIALPLKISHYVLTWLSFKQFWFWFWFIFRCAHLEHSTEVWWSHRYFYVRWLRPGPVFLCAHRDTELCD